MINYTKKSVDNEQIDIDHEIIFELGHRFRNEPTVDLAREIIKTIRDHMESEEIILFKLDVIQCNFHTAVHNGFRRYLDAIESVLEKDFESAKYAIEQAVFGWFLNHVNGSDSLIFQKNDSQKTAKSMH